VACSVNMSNKPLNGSYQAMVLAGDSPDSYNDIQNPNRVVPKKTKLTFTKGSVNLPPHSLTIVKVIL
jgi:alpha-N-arabinofuranosidase